MGGRPPGWLFWFAALVGWLLGVAVARTEGASGVLVGVFQLIPTIVVVLVAATLLELAGAAVSPGAGENASGVAAVLALAAALDVAPLSEASVHVVLTGAGSGSGIGLGRYLRGRRGALKATNTVVVGVGPCAHGVPRYWVSDGPFVPMRHFKALRELCRRAGAADPELGLAFVRGRGFTPALPARFAGIPSVAIGALDALGLSPHRNQPSDAPGTVDLAALGATVEIGLLLCEEIDDYLADFAARHR
jgi:hypothetical protein